MMKKIWLPVVLVAIIVAGYYYLTSKGQLSNNVTVGNNTTSQDGTLGGLIAPTGSIDVAVQAILQAAANDQAVLANDAGESALVNNINQQIGNINQPYENQF